MKKLITRTAIVLTAFVLSFTACRKESIIAPPQWVVINQYSSLTEFRQGIQKVETQLEQFRVIAYLDTLQNGYPNLAGRRQPLIQFASTIIQKLYGNDQQIQDGVNDVFHFDGSTFSLISYIYKAQLAGDISLQTMVDIINTIPLPPIPMANFEIPADTLPVATVKTGDCCKDNPCSPKINIKVTWVYKPACGNYEKKITGYPVGDKLTGDRGVTYRFEPEISGCPCPGTITVTTTAPPNGQYAIGTSKRGASVTSLTAGVYTITFTYTVCDQTVSKTFTLTIK